MSAISSTALAILPQRTSVPAPKPESTHSFSFLESIIAIAKRILGAFTFSHSEPAKTQPTPIVAVAPEEDSDLFEIFDGELEPQEFHVSKKPRITMPIFEADTTPTKQEETAPKQTETPVPEEVSQKFALTGSDKLLTASNLFQWGLVGASFCGLAPAVAGTLGMIAGVGSEIANYCMLPEDASLLRRAMTFPVVSKAILGLNPVVKGISQAYSLISSVQTSAGKLSEAWEGLKSDPANAMKAGSVHLFNLASNVAFAAEGAGLITLRPSSIPDVSKKGDSRTEDDRSEPIKQIKIATVYDNKDSKTGLLNVERQKISDIVVQNHRDYADKWDLVHDVVTDNLVAGQCTDPSSSKAVDCSAYMNKIQYYRMQCADPAQQGKLVIYGDDDLVYTNMGINPLDAFNRLRNGKNTSVVMMREGGDWAKYFPLPGYKNHDPRVSVNSGFIMGRIDRPFCDLIERTWEHRNTRMDPGPNVKDCPTVAFCKTHGVTSLGDQTAIALALQDDLSVMDRTVTIVLPRDTSAPHRADIAFNTLHRGGCHQEIVNGKLEAPFDIGDYDRNDYPDGIWREGDWNGQTAGFRVMGKYPLPRNAQGYCIEDPNQPTENIRLKKVLEMFPSKPERDFTFAVANVPDGNSAESQYGHITLANHKEYAKKHGAKFYHETDKTLLEGQCLHPLTKNAVDCSGYMMKVQAMRKWLSQPNTSGKEEWLCIADDDGLYGRMRTKPSQVIDDMQGSSNASILIVEEPQKRVTRINTGFIFVRKDDQSRKFIEQVWNERDTATHTPDHPTCFSHGACLNQVSSVNDQSCFELALYKNPQALTDGVVKIVPIRAPDRPYGLNTVYRKGCFIRDQAKWSSTMPINYEEDDRNTKTDCESQAGDYYFQTAGVPRVGRFCDDPPSTRRPIRKEYITRMLEMVKV